MPTRPARHRPSSARVASALLAAALVALHACGPGGEPPPPGDGVRVAVVVEGPGRVAVGALDLACGDDCTWYVPDDAVTVVDALPLPGQVFVGWAGDCAVLPNPCVRTFEEGATVRARFAPHALRLSLIGDGEGAFQIDGGGILATCDADCAIALDQPLQLAITNYDAAATGTELGAWGGACTGAPRSDYCLVSVVGATEVAKTWIHPPRAVDDAFATTRNAPLAVDADTGVLANDVDSPGDALRAELLVDVEHGALELAADGGFRYTPDAGFVGRDGFRYRVVDAFGSSDAADVAIEVVNRPPTAAPDAYGTAHRTELVVAAADGVLANDVDPDGDPLTALLVAGPGHGVLTLAADGGFRYQPTGNFSGVDGFSYRASDGDLESEVVAVEIVVEAPTIGPPVAAADPARGR